MGPLLVGLAISGAVVYARKARARRGRAFERLVADLAYRMRAPLTQGEQGPEARWHAGQWPAALQLRKYDDTLVPVLVIGPDDRLRHPFTLVLREGVDGVVEAPVQFLTGDTDFDRLVYAQGDLLAARAACDTRTRRALSRIFQPSTDEDFLELYDGTLAVSIATPDPSDLEAAERRMSRALFLARSIAIDERTLLERLLLRFKEEPRPDQRRLLLRELVSEAPDDPDVLRALHDALDDAAPIVRLDAIAMLRSEPAWHAAADLAREPRNSTGHRRAALQLLDQGPQALARPTWHAILSEPPGPLHPEIIERVVAAGDWTARPRLRALLGLANDDAALAVCRALAHFGPGDPQDELALITQLADPDPAVHQAVCGALVAVGTRKGLDALRAPEPNRARAAARLRAAHALGARLGLG
ncbi:MAG: hypothetical protein KC613_25445, partial [Myxococcales bacterium]|nr:hypothetical protein [Myxococcales bacterium]